MCIVEPNKSEAPMKPASWVSRSTAAKPDRRSNDVGTGDGVDEKLCALTRGDLSASAVLAVVVEATR